MTALALVNPQNKNITFRVFTFDDNTSFSEVQRTPSFSMILVTHGSGKLETDFSVLDFESNVLMCFTPYQPYKLKYSGRISGVALLFHSDFLCVYKHHKEIACNGVLFNDIYKSLLVSLRSEETTELEKLAIQMLTEVANTEIAQYELLVSYLKIFLITATRIKIAKDSAQGKINSSTNEPFIVQRLKEAIEKHYRTKHTPGDYAALLEVSPTSLAKALKKHLNKTLTNLISERIVIEAKRELYLTSKPVKEIAFELGFPDEFYFSRFFKTNADVSPQIYRNTVGYAKAEA